MYTIIASAEDHTKYKIDCEDSVKRELRSYFSFKVPGAEYMPLYKSRIWDGKIKLYEINSSTLPCGLKSYLKRFCDERHYNVIFDDKSVDPIDINYESFDEFYKTLNVTVKKEPVIPHPHQKNAVLHALTNARSVVVSPTGSGKSLIIYLIIRYLLRYCLKAPKKILLLVPTVGLVQQMEADFFDYSKNDKSWSVTKFVHKISAGKEKLTDKPVVVSTWQSVYKLPKEWFDQFEAVIFDECHLVKADSLVNIGKKLTKAWFRLGTTGTLDQTLAHKLSIEGTLGPSVQFITTRGLISKGVLAKLGIDCIVLDYDEQTRHRVKKLKYQDEMAYLVENSKRNDFIVKLCGETQGNTLVLFNYVEKHGKPLYELIKKQYPEKKVYFISGKVDAENREFIRKIIDKEKNAILVASFGTTSTGINIVHLDNIIFASPTKSVIRLLQSIGRGLRTSAIKQTLKVFDIVDDMSWKSYKNHVLKHFEQRIKIYKKEKFDHKVFKIKI